MLAGKRRVKNIGVDMMVNADSSCNLWRKIFPRAKNDGFFRCGDPNYPAKFGDLAFSHNFHPHFHQNFTILPKTFFFKFRKCDFFSKIWCAMLADPKVDNFLGVADLKDPGGSRPFTRKKNQSLSSGGPRRSDPSEIPLCPRSSFFFQKCCFFLI